MYTQTNDQTVTYKGQTRPLVREGAPQRQDNKFQSQTLGKGSNLWSNVHKVDSTPRHTDRQTDCQPQSDSDSLFRGLETIHTA
jgi:hypothetical protein